MNATAPSHPAGGAGGAGGQGGGGGGNLEDYNPFDKNRQTTTSGGGSDAPAVMKAEAEQAPAQPKEAPPSYTASAQQQITTADFQVLCTT